MMAVRLGTLLMLAAAPLSLAEIVPGEVEFTPRMMETKDAACVGHLGDPALGLALDSWRLQWHPSGRIFSSSSSSNIVGALLHAWQPPQGAEPARRHGALNVGPPWVLSSNGGTLFARLDLHGSPLPPKAGVVLGCLRLGEKKKLWHVALQRGDQAGSVVFTKDDRALLLSTEFMNQQVLTLLNAATGAVQGRTPLPERTSGREDSGRALAAWKDEFILLRRQAQGGTRLQRVRTDPLRVVGDLPLKLKPEALEELETSGFDSLCLSADEQHLVVHGDGGYLVLEDHQGQWVATLQGEAGDGFHSAADLQAVAVSPDSRLLLVATGEGGRVIDLATGRVAHKLSSGGAAAAFSPDGKRVLVAEHSGLDWWDTTKWERHQTPETQHDCAVEGVMALPGGESVLSWDHNGLIVWDVATRKPRAMLHGPENDCLLQPPVLVKGGQELVAAANREIVRWKLPPLSGPVPAQPVVVKSARAFPQLPEDPDDAVPQHPFERVIPGLAADAAGQRLLVVRKGRPAELHDEAAPDQVRHFPELAGVVYAYAMDMAFSGRDAVVLLDDDKRELLRLDLVSGKVTRTPVAATPGKLRLWGAVQGAGSLPRTGVSFIHPDTAQVMHSLASPGKRESFHGTVGLPLSQDGRLAATCFSDFVSEEIHLAVMEVATGRMLAWHALHRPVDATCLAFTEDGRGLLMGHGNTAVSVWEVAKLAPPPPDMAAAAPTPSSGPATKPSIGAASGAASSPGNSTTPRRTVHALDARMPERPLVDRKGRRWSFTSDGACAVEGLLPSFGKLTVNGLPFESRAARHRHPVGEKSASFERGTAVSNDGGVAGQPLWITRQLSPGLGFMDEAVTALDGFTNTGEKPLELEVVHEVRFPPEAQGLLANESGRLMVPEDGRLPLGKKDHWIAPAGYGQPGTPLPAVRLQTWTSPAPPAGLHWNATTKVLRTTHRITLPPAETRWLAHEVAVVDRRAEGTPDLVWIPHTPDPGHFLPPGSAREAANFACVNMWNEDHREGPLPLTMAWSEGQPRPAPEKDALGFTWELRHDLSRAGELGATAVLTLWMDGHPLAFHADKLLHPHSNGRLLTPPLQSYVTADKALTVRRRPYLPPDGGPTVWQDTLRNVTQEKVRRRLSYVTTFQKPVVAVWDARGRKLEAHAKNGLKLTAETGGACALVLEGEQQPATLLAFPTTGTVAAPTLRWLGPSAALLEYEVELEPQAEVEVLHGACQRPLGAFAPVATAFADWLPLQSPPAMPSMGPPPAAGASTALRK